MNELVSIVIPCYNYAEFLIEAIDSALDQTYSPIEIIFVNDGSTDNSMELSFRRDIIRIDQSNQGVSAARNIGTIIAKGKWICCLDADDLLTPEYVSKCMRKSTHFDVIGTGYEEFGDSETILILPEEPSFEKQNKVHCSALYKKSMWEAIGGWNEDMKEGYEDWDFWYRASSNGFKIYNIQEPLLLYRKHGKTRNDKVIVNRKEWRSKITNL